jgi:alpha-methylacyl-CoA racemase
MTDSAFAPSSRGPLAGLRVVEFAGLGPGPFACMLLSDMGADIVTIDRPGRRLGDESDIIGRGRTVVLADLKLPDARADVLRLLASADVLVEGFRPGVMERLGLGPDIILASNPRLVYGRITGWGQDGPLARSAGHDINYLALTGALHAVGPAGGPPVPPLNLVGDYGGGSLYLVVGILAALFETRRSGRGQVVDAAIIDGVNSMMSLCAAGALRGTFIEQRASNVLDGGAPYYGTYETADGKHVCVGAIEPPFFADLCERLGLDACLRDAQHDRSRWPMLRAAFERTFRKRTRDAWASLFEGTDACVTPVVTLSEAACHVHQQARGAFVDVNGVRHPAPTPRFSRTASVVQGPAPGTASDLTQLIDRWSRERTDFSMGAEDPAGS